MDAKPLVTISMMTYNQEKYVRDSIRGLLAQTYNPLEIVISDDCSTDRTWSIILEESENYKQSGGTHQIILNRNEKNLGVANHFNKLMAMGHGELVVCNGGDDVSMPNRVAEIVKAWIDRPDATVFCHGAFSIGMDGKKINDNITFTTPLYPLGAMMAYSIRVFREFGPISEACAWEDDVYARRGQMLGECVQIQKPLLYYRVGCGGISSGGDGYNRLRRARVARGCLAAARQSRKDLMVCRERIGEVKYRELLEIIDLHERHYANELDLVSSRNPVRKVRALNALYGNYSVWSKFKVLLLVLLPPCFIKIFKRFRIWLKSLQDHRNCIGVFTFFVSLYFSVKP